MLPGLGSSRSSLRFRRPFCRSDKPNQAMERNRRHRAAFGFQHSSRRFLILIVRLTGICFRRWSAVFSGPPSDVVAVLLDRPQVCSDGCGVVTRLEHQADAIGMIFVRVDRHSALTTRRTKRWRGTARSGDVWLCIHRFFFASSGPSSHRSAKNYSHPLSFSYARIIPTRSPSIIAL